MNDLKDWLVSFSRNAPGIVTYAPIASVLFIEAAIDPGKKTTEKRTRTPSDFHI